MDSTLPGRVYDTATLAAGGTNADDVSDALRDLPVVTFKENTSPIWHREEQVIAAEPGPGRQPSFMPAGPARRRMATGRSMDHLFSFAENRLTSFFGYLAAANPRTRFLVYSRGRIWPDRRGGGRVGAPTSPPVFRG